MKIYVNNIPLAKLQKKTLEKFFIKHTKSSVFYSEEGIFTIDRNKLFKLKIGDVPSKKYMIDGFEIYLDHSKILSKEEYYHLPINHYKEDIIEEVYKLNNQTDLQLNIVVKDNFVQDFYFLTKCDIDTIGIKKDIITFLSLLKFKNDM